MTTRIVRLLVSLVGVTLASCGAPSAIREPAAASHVPEPSQPPLQSAPVMEVPSSVARLAVGAFLFGDLGAFQRTATTDNAEAQAYFNQGMQLAYGFNHDEAARSFARAAVLDPTCAICFWGASYTLGPNYNIPLLPDRAQAAWDALTSARATIDGSSEVERALIEALAARSSGPTYLDPPTMQPYLVAYATAMRGVAQRFPNDDDVQTLFAEAAMTTNAWKLWTSDGEPAEGTPEIVATLERVLMRNPDHPGANHFYIHAIEASRTPERGVPSADRLPALMPGAGHTVHMPAHIYQRVGRYADASEVNRRAIVVDNRYLSRTTPPGYYPFYLAHNHGFLAYSSSMEGRSAEAIAASRQSAGAMPMGVVCSMPGMDFFLAEPLLVMVRFGKWEELLAEPRPDAKYSALTGLYLHAHGMALASTGKITEAKADLEELKRIATEVPQDLMTGLSNGRAVLTLAATMLAGRIAQQEKHKDDAIRLYEEAVGMEDRLAYDEPADWFYPVRHYLGAALLDAKRGRDAEAVYRADLAHNPANGWALFGLAQSLRAQRRVADATAAETAFKAAWPNADITLTRSAF